MDKLKIDEIAAKAATGEIKVEELTKIQEKNNPDDQEAIRKAIQEEIDGKWFFCF